MFFPPDARYDRPLLGYIHGDRFSLAIDAGSSASHVKLFYDELERERLPLPSLTVLTHSHWDHSFGLCAINGLSIANSDTYNDLLLEISRGNSEIYRSCISEDYSYLRREYSSPSDINVVLPDISFDDSLTIDLGGVHAKIFRTVSPHSDDCTLIFIPEYSILFLGDASSGKITSDADLETGGQYSERELREYISCVRSIGAKTVVNSHSGDDPCSEELAYLEDILARL